MRIDPWENETLEIYLVRCLAEARRTRSTVAACYEGIAVAVHSRMTTRGLRELWNEARVNSPEQKT
jgi:hypothetical protein